MCYILVSLQYLSKYRVNKGVDRTVPYINSHNPTCTQVGVSYMIINCIQYPGSDKTMQLLTRESCTFQYFFYCCLSIVVSSAYKCL